MQWLIQNTVLNYMYTHHILRQYRLIISPSSMKSKLSIYPRISCFYLILLRFSSSLSMAKRTVEVKLPSVCPRRHSNPVLFVALKPYVLVASGSTPSQIKPQAHQWVLWLGPHCSQLFWGGLPINFIST